MNTVQASKLGIARTFQNIRLFDNMSVEDNVRIGLHNQVALRHVFRHFPSCRSIGAASAKHARKARWIC